MGCIKISEEICVSLLEQSDLKFNEDFFYGYSPERINPGDKDHTVTKIKKITSGSTPEIAEKIDEIYRRVIMAGTYKASSIKVAEAAKVIENTQHDINIAFVNELKIIFDKMGIDTNEVLLAARTKWNFLDFTPGLVGGHCIGVDPYYLTHKAEELGYHPEVIRASRKINDNMGFYHAREAIKLMIKNDCKIKNSRVLVFGLTFKENCPDIRNSRVIDVINELKDFGCIVDVYDPLANDDDVKREYGFSLAKSPNFSKYDLVILAVAHNEFKKINFENLFVYDIKNVYLSANARL